MQTDANRMRSLLQEILDAGNYAVVPLDMKDWYCGTAACLCGDVGIYRAASDPEKYITDEAVRFSDELDIVSDYVFRNVHVAESIYGSNAGPRRHCALESGIFSPEELLHPHLTTDHYSRELAHDYVRLVMSKLPT